MTEQMPTEYTALVEATSANADSANAEEAKGR